jgi:hypothetical protein
VRPCRLAVAARPELVVHLQTPLHRARRPLRLGPRLAVEPGGYCSPRHDLVRHLGVITESFVRVALDCDVAGDDGLGGGWGRGGYK